MARTTDIEQIGSIYVTPISDAGSGGKKIPFEFNPEIQESSSITAKYQAISILSRIGNIQSFVGVDSLSITLNTKYFATTDTEENAEHLLDGWMVGFSLVDIQKYELLYRSLNLPDYSNKSSIESGYKYLRPPIIRIVMGAKNTPSIGTVPYSNLLTYPQQVIESGDRLRSSGGFRFYRSFIATSVTITKNLDESPVYLDSNSFLVDTHGFEVSVSLIEISPSVNDSFPTFNDYYSNGKGI